MAGGSLFPNSVRAATFSQAVRSAQAPPATSQRVRDDHHGTVRESMGDQCRERGVAITVCGRGGHGAFLQNALQKGGTFRAMRRDGEKIRPRPGCG